MNFELLVATNNAHKLKEIRKILSPYHITVYGMKDLNIDIGEVEENGKTYFENALIKATALQKITTMPIIADDSGIEIEALDNAPGLYSSRYASSFGGYPQTFEHIFKEIDGKTRRARFVCDIVLVNVEEKPLKFEAIIPGHIVEKVTDQSDFGYDPIFIEDSLNKTYASMSEDEKNRVSHRGVALRKLLTYLRINGLAH
ncbi:MAG: RdgB/HAM1 family non-canonical purine NTP pyrophosphatase [Bacilli bacterium]|nr:RdgB/HAM1 family non-canonical purine NTP pyrophosphatase [Bacilli bacterium]